MTLSRRKLLQQSLLAAPMASGSILFTGGIAAFVEPLMHAQNLASSTKSLVIVRAGESRSGKPWNLAGTPHVWDKISGKDVGGRLAMLQVTTPPSVGSPMHIHEIQNEWMFLLAGSIGIQAGGERAVLRAGDIFMVPAGVPHAYIVLGKEPANHLNLYDPAGEMEAFFENFDVDRKTIAHDPAAADALDKKYRTKTVGPPLQASSFAI